MISDAEFTLLKPSSPLLTGLLSLDHSPEKMKYVSWRSVSLLPPARVARFGSISILGRKWTDKRSTTYAALDSDKAHERAHVMQTDRGDTTSHLISEEKKKNWIGGLRCHQLHCWLAAISLSHSGTRSRSLYDLCLVIADETQRAGPANDEGSLLALSISFTLRQQ